MKSKAIILLLLMGFSWLPIASQAHGRDSVDVDGVAFARHLTVDGQSFHLLGAGLFRYRVVFRAYAGALYVAHGHSADDALQPGRPLRLELEYFWPIRGTQFADAAWPFLESNLQPYEFERIRERAERLGRLFRDVEPGDRYALTFIPGRGTTLTLNDQPLGTIEGDDFAAAYFRIWLGEQPINARFRDTLLARR